MDVACNYPIEVDMDGNPLARSNNESLGLLDMIAMGMVEELWIAKTKNDPFAFGRDNNKDIDDLCIWSNIINREFLTKFNMRPIMPTPTLSKEVVIVEPNVHAPTEEVAIKLCWMQPIHPLPIIIHQPRRSHLGCQHLKVSNPYSSPHSHTTRQRHIQQSQPP